MKKHERILERRKLFKQELLRPLAAMMYYEIKVRELRYKEKLQIGPEEKRLLGNLTELSESFHDFLQSHEFTHLEKLARELMQKLKASGDAVGELGKFYAKKPERPEFFEPLPKGIAQMRREIEKFDAFEKRN
ncbi:MAG: hypothetical protein ABIG96_01225 [Candidatus Micrarchaeota archaeon]